MGMVSIFDYMQEIVADGTVSYRNDPKFSADKFGQTVQTQIRLSSLVRVYTVCHSVCIDWTRYSMAEPHISNFRVITTNFLGVQIFRKFTVVEIYGASNNVLLYCDIVSLSQGALVVSL